MNTPLHEASLLKNETVVKAILEKKDVFSQQGLDHHDWNMLTAENQVRRLIIQIVSNSIYLTISYSLTTSLSIQQLWVEVQTLYLY